MSNKALKSKTASQSRYRPTRAGDHTNRRHGDRHCCDGRDGGGGGNNHVDDDHDGGDDIDSGGDGNNYVGDHHGTTS